MNKSEIYKNNFINKCLDYFSLHIYPSAKMYIL